MPKVSIDDVGSLGVIKDIVPHKLPPEAWEEAESMRCIDNGVERIGGRAQVFGTPTVAPHFVLPVRSPTTIFWIYTSLTKAYVYNGVSHTNITRASGDYTATLTREWNGTLLGGIPILNNGQDAPQFWDVALDTGTPLADLTNWPASDTARIIRAFGSFLVAFDVTDASAGNRYPHMVRWSDSADPGSLPSSWDVADATKDAGENDLPDVNAGIIRDALPLRGRMFIYKDGSTWRMTEVASSYIFNFDTYLETSGILGPRCVSITPDGLYHFVVTQDDIILHDGQSKPESLLNTRMRRYLQNTIDSENYINSFTLAHPEKNEVWFCYPQSGSTQPDRALIWSQRENAITEADISFRGGAVGALQSPTVETWTTISDTWTSVSGPWASAERRVTIVCDPANTKLLRLDSGETNDGTAFTGTLQRTGLSIVGRKRNGEWIVDHESRKFIWRVRPKVSGGAVDIRVGFQELVDGSVDWTSTKNFDPATDLYVDFEGCGQAVAVEFSAANPYRLAGYELEIEVIGVY